ncbi:MAG TPA: hypothetical protein VJN02_04005 [Gammaproteobacteria bacterium]|nr:hypothetical protein [Gammaproteobacteria bacterium]
MFNILKAIFAIKDILGILIRAWEYISGLMKKKEQEKQINQADELVKTIDSAKTTKELAHAAKDADSLFNPDANK